MVEMQDALSLQRIVLLFVAGVFAKCERRACVFNRLEAAPFGSIDVFGQTEPL
ncbi:MAG: hypothetical protein ACI9R3_001464, partial [Verrucomicrobiales bacterium]